MSGTPGGQFRHQAKLLFLVCIGSDIPKSSLELELWLFWRKKETILYNNWLENYKVPVSVMEKGKFMQSKLSKENSSWLSKETLGSMYLTETGLGLPSFKRLVYFSVMTVGEFHSEADLCIKIKMPKEFFDILKYFLIVGCQKR